MSSSSSSVLSSRAPHLQGLDVLRAAAITLVLAFHYVIFFGHPDCMRQWTSFGWTGVDLFFVLSGYLISSQLLAAGNGNGIHLGSYFIKRSFRILPLFWLTLAAYFLFPSWHEREALAPLWKFLTFTLNLNFDALNHGTFSHAWSLCIEEQFYLLLPFVFLVSGKSLTFRKIFLATSGLMVCGFVVRWVSWETLVAVPSGPGGSIVAGTKWTPEWARWIYYCTQTRLDGLLTGVAIACLFYFREDLKRACFQRDWLFAAFGLGGLWGATKFCTPYFTHGCALYGYPLISVSYGCLLIAVLSPRFRLSNAAFFPFKWLATLSYGIYLSHKMVGHVVQHWCVERGMDAKSWQVLGVTFSAFVVVGLALHFLVERPAFGLRDRMLGWYRAREA